MVRMAVSFDIIEGCDWLYGILFGLFPGILLPRRPIYRLPVI